MTSDEITEIQNLALMLKSDLTILKTAIENPDGDLEILDLAEFINYIYENSNNLVKIFTTYLNT